MTIPHSRQLSDLREKLDTYFNLGDLRSICFSLNIDYDNLAGDTKRAKAEALIKYTENRGQLNVLTRYLQELRPNLDWNIQLPTDAVCPYRGLFAFHEQDATYFFGRDTFVNTLTTSVQSQALVAIIGPSGSGKSSIVLAGLLPRLRLQGNWIIISFRPTAEPLKSLSAVLVPFLEPELSETARLIKSNEMAKAMSEQIISLVDVLKCILQMHSIQSRLLLIVDQFEELYTLCSDIALRQKFLDELLAVYRCRNELHALPFTIVLTLRADFLEQALSYRQLADALQNHDLKLGPMTREEFMEAIVRPALDSGVSFEPGLVKRILNDVGTEPGHLPLLEFALTLLWERQVDHVLTHEAYDANGCIDGALANHADNVYAKLSADKKAQTQKLFVQLVQPGRENEDTRRLARRAELVGIEWELVQFFADERLVVTDPMFTGQPTVEVVHEALIQHWRQMRAWMEQDRTFRDGQEQIRSELLRWENVRNEDDLLSGTSLREAVKWLENRRADLSQSEIDFIQHSLKSNEGRKQRNLLWLVLWGALGAALGTGLLMSAAGYILWKPADPQFYKLPLPITVFVFGLMGSLIGGVQGAATTFGSVVSANIRGRSLAYWVVGGMLCSGAAGGILFLILKLGGTFIPGLSYNSIFVVGFILFALSSGGAIFTIAIGERQISVFLQTIFSALASASGSLLAVWMAYQLFDFSQGNDFVSTAIGFSALEIMFGAGLALGLTFASRQGSRLQRISFLGVSNE